MSYLTKMALALTLGIAAAGANWLYLRIQTQPTLYVAMASSIKRGSVVQQSDLVAVPVPGDPSKLRRTFVPFESGAILFGSKATRDFERGDIVFSRDIVGPTAVSEWEVVGPFELISVGERFTKVDSQGDALAPGNTRGNTVTIAVDADFDEQTSRLLSLIAGGQSSNAGRKPSIIAVQVVPSRGSRREDWPVDSNSAGETRSAEFFANSGTGLQPKGDSLTSQNPDRSHRDEITQVVYQTVSLDGIPNVPAVLLEGDLIRFVVPKTSLSHPAGQ
jgi:hypothetical protein